MPEFLDVISQHGLILKSLNISRLIASIVVLIFFVCWHIEVSQSKSSSCISQRNMCSDPGVIYSIETSSGIPFCYDQTISHACITDYGSEICLLNLAKEYNLQVDFSTRSKYDVLGYDLVIIIISCFSILLIVISSIFSLFQFNTNNLIIKIFRRLSITIISTLSVLTFIVSSMFQTIFSDSCPTNSTSTSSSNNICEKIKQCQMNYKSVIDINKNIFQYYIMIAIILASFISFISILSLLYESYYHNISNNIQRQFHISKIISMRNIIAIKSQWNLSVIISDHTKECSICLKKLQKNKILSEKHNDSVAETVSESSCYSRREVILSSNHGGSKKNIGVNHLGYDKFSSNSQHIRTYAMSPPTSALDNDDHRTMGNNQYGNTYSNNEVFYGNAHINMHCTSTVGGSMKVPICPASPPRASPYIPSSHSTTTNYLDDSKYQIDEEKGIPTLD